MSNPQRISFFWKTHWVTAVAILILTSALAWANLRGGTSGFDEKYYGWPYYAYTIYSDSNGLALDYRPEVHTANLIIDIAVAFVLVGVVLIIFRRIKNYHVMKAYVLFKHLIRPGPKFSISLRALILLVIIAGGLLWLSVRPTYSLGVDSYGMGNVIYAGKRGWPYECLYSYGYAGASAHNQDALDKAVPRYLAPGEDVKLDFDYKALGLNLCINLAIICSVAIAQQHFNRRKV